MTELTFPASLVISTGPTGTPALASAVTYLDSNNLNVKFDSPVHVDFYIVMKAQNSYDSFKVVYNVYDYCKDAHFTAMKMLFSQ